MRVVDITGERVHSLVVVRRSGSKNGNSYWECNCDCGKIHYATASDLKVIKSCGCHKNKNTAERNRKNAKHGMTGSMTYHTWYCMKQRCNYKKDKSYKYYGATGVTICDEWYDFLNFLRDMGVRPDGRTLDRINPCGNYEPSNCRWATPKEQANSLSPLYSV